MNNTNNWNKKNVSNVNNWQVTCASDVEEFFYESSDKVVTEGDAVGIEIENEKSVDLVLFSNIYWTDENLY
jgi:hypothetical protein